MQMKGEENKQFTKNFAIFNFKRKQIRAYLCKYRDKNKHCEVPKDSKIQGGKLTGNLKRKFLLMQMNGTVR